VAYTCDPRTWEAEAGELWVQGQPGPDNKNLTQINKKINKNHNKNHCTSVKNGHCQIQKDKSWRKYGEKQTLESSGHGQIKVWYIW
jgi:hypothetical protein